ncbi:uncharacterized protein LOC120709604 [Panicum virgatum]|uniref:uncharacterized protein LOC120709604 n=1 Tax=Panicum virgatum TaxID=38727 RepID=UPI0019D5845B|nr:uncharacterized protein LOC120709604 [Panicum virgatum]
MPRERDGLARGLEVEAALAAEAAWELRDAVASMAGFHMDADSTLDLPIELGGDGSLSTDKSCLFTWLFLEFFRNKLSGALTGLTRVRRFQQDDAHVFCRENQTLFG